MMHLAQFLSNHKQKNLQTCSTGTSGEGLLKAAMKLGLWPIFLQISKSFYPTTERFRGYSNEPGVHLSSVHTFVHKHFCICSILEYPLEYFDDTSQLCRTGHDNVSRTKMRALAFLAHLSLLRLSFWDTAMSVVRVDIRDVRDVRPSTF